MEIRRTIIGEIFYYHPNHLGSTSFVTDQNQTITQGFLYAPFGEITTEYNVNFGNNVIPKYSFNAKELDEETGMYYYEARYYNPPVFTSRDALFEKYFWLSPYAYCANNPVKYVDPTGCEVGNFYKANGAYLGTDGLSDGEVYIVRNRADKKMIRKNNKAGSTTQVSEVASAMRLPYYETRQEIYKQLKEGDDANPFAEHGGIYGIDVNTNKECARPAAEGPTIDPSKKGVIATIDYNTVNQSFFLKKGTYHGHPSGEKDGAYFVQNPLTVDYENAKNRAKDHNMYGTNIIIGMGNKKVYLYNSNYQHVTISLLTFLNLK